VKVVFGAVSGFLFVCEISREQLNRFAPNSHRRLVWFLALTSLKVKAKVTRDKTTFFGPFGGMLAVCLVKHR